MIDLHEIAKRENEKVEWKASVADIDNVIKTIVAFSNDFSNVGGGYIVCGALETQDEHGFQKVKYVGLNSSRIKEIEGKVSSDSKTKVNPPIVPLMEELEVKDSPDKRILVIIVPATEQAHSYRASGKDASTYYIRSDNNTIEARNGLLRELLVRKNAIEPWDRRINRDASIDDVDFIVFREYLQQMGLWNKNKALEDYFSPTEKIADFTPPLVGRITINQELRLRNFSVLMFSTPLSFYDGAYSIFSVYRGTDRSERTGERIQITGNVVQQARTLIERLNTEAYTAFDKEDEAPNLMKYPTLALKEAVVNALAHRDYESNQPVRITVFADRIEIYSPGGLPSQVNKEKFLNGRATAYWRNQALNYLFNKLQLAQAEGQGIPTIFRTMEESGNPAPSFEIEADSVLCILPAHPRHRTIKIINEIENKVILRNYDEAATKVKSLLKEDPYNFRAIELLCEIANYSSTQMDVVDFIVDNKIELDEINPSTLVSIADTISGLGDNEIVKEVISRVLDKATSRKLKEEELVKVAHSYRKIGDDEKTETFITSLFNDYPTLRKKATLLQLRGRARLGLAKLCEESTKDKQLSPKMKALSWDKLRSYLDKAEKDLNDALDNSDSPSDISWIKKDISYLQNKKLATAKPLKRHSTIYVNNLPRGINKERIKEIFDRYGKVSRIVFPNPNARSYALIVFEQSDDANKARKDHNKLSIDNNAISIAPYNPNLKGNSGKQKHRKKYRKRNDTRQ